MRRRYKTESRNRPSMKITHCSDFDVFGLCWYSQGIWRPVWIFFVCRVQRTNPVTVTIFLPIYHRVPLRATPSISIFSSFTSPLVVPLAASEGKFQKLFELFQHSWICILGSIVPYRCTSPIIAIAAISLNSRSLHSIRFGCVFLSIMRPHFACIRSVWSYIQRKTQTHTYTSNS